jgi:hypothetical protein
MSLQVLFTYFFNLYIFELPRNVIIIWNDLLLMFSHIKAKQNVWLLQKYIKNLLLYAVTLI